VKQGRYLFMIALLFLPQTGKAQPDVNEKLFTTETKTNTGEKVVETDIKADTGRITTDIHPFFADTNDTEVMGLIDKLTDRLDSLERRVKQLESKVESIQPGAPNNNKE